MPKNKKLNDVKYSGTNEEMNTDEAIKNGEILAFLRGEKEYRIETSQYMPGVEPTDVGKVLSNAIYKVYKENT